MMQEASAADAAHEAAGFTGRFTAGLRFVESTRVPQPLILSDPLAGALAGERGLALATQELEQLTRDQGPGKHLRVPARSRLIDDLLEQEIVALRLRSSTQGPTSGTQHGSGSGRREIPKICCQVVSLGAGMCTRPWRLASLAPCRVLELDLPHIAATKTALLQEARAQTSTPSPSFPSSPSSARKTASAPVEAGVADAEVPPAVPLLAGSYACLGADLSDESTAEGLAGALAGAGFDSSTPTIWVLEALLYYMPLGSASELLCRLAGLSAPGSRLIATCVDRELLEASLRGVPKGHVFADLWHFESEALLYDTRAFRECWQVDWTGQPEPQTSDGDAGSAAAATSDPGPGAPPPGRRLPASTRRLARERLGADTYVALYGGSELLFVAGLRQQLQ